MTPSDFTAWAALMKERGWSARECARRLGCGVNQVRVWSDTGAPLYIGLACAALVRGVKPWSAVIAKEHTP